MKVLVVGSGGREHALVKALKKSPRVTEVLAAPGNGGICREARCFPVPPEDVQGLLKLAQREKVDLTVVGPELPLSLGLVDLFQSAGLRILGPKQDAARLESSKVFCKEFLKKYRIPTARYEIFSDGAKAKKFLQQNSQSRWVIKVDGLAAGKGVFVPASSTEATSVIDQVFDQLLFGKQRVVIEEFLDGEELSFMVLCDGTEGMALASSQDHKRLLDHDEGPNTGGMGAYSPAPLMSEKLSDEVMRTIIAPTLAGMREEGCPFVGILYAGLMIVGDKPFVLEYNVRFGDPEAEVILPRLKSDWLDLFEAAIDKKLASQNPQWTEESAVGVVLAAQGYPANPKKGDEITGLEEASRTAVVYHGGTVAKDEKFFTSGGRVLTVTALGETLPRALEKSYAAVCMIHFAGIHYRKDIAAKGLKRSPHA
jgi:phosphoribosylamine--glycine ligase